VVNQKGNTALHIASLAGKLDVVKVLLANGASVNARSKASTIAIYTRNFIRLLSGIISSFQQYFDQLIA